MENSNCLKVMVIFGTRPEAIKMVPIIQELRKNPDRFCVKVCVTAQHREMLDQVLNLFDIKPDYDLDIMRKNQNLFQITISILTSMQNILRDLQPDIVLVQGDTTTAFSVSLACFYLKVPVGHVEAGLRTNNKYSPYPEEINRRLISHLADLHFAPTENAKQNLLSESICPHTIYVTGNTVIDTLLTIVKRESDFQLTLSGIDFEKKRVILVTAHRRENLGEPLKNICLALKDLVKQYEDIQIIYPVHLNPNVQKIVYDMLDGVERVHLTKPLGYEEFAHLMCRSYLILTDSGGIQEEAPSLGKPVLVLRTMTERPEAVEAGAAKVIGTKRENIVTAVRMLLDNKDEYDRMANVCNPYGDGNAAKRVVEILRECYSKIKVSDYEKN